MGKYQIIDKKDFFYSGKTRPVEFRIHELKRLKNLIKSHEDEITEALYLDLHKSPFESYATEIGLVYEEINLHIRKLKRWTKKHYVSSPIAAFPSRSYIQYEPYGISLILAPWNYPFQLAMAPLAGAIAAGNCVVVKPSEISTNTAKLIEKMINSTFTKEFVEVVNGDASTSKELLQLDFDFIFFTGSTKVGKIVAQAAAEKLTPCILELGGKSPCIIDATANIKLAARRIIWGKCINAGQTCIAPDYLFVEASIKEKLVEEMQASITEMFGNEILKNNDFPRIINQANMDRLKKLMLSGKIISGGEIDEKNRFISPTLFDSVPFDSPLMQEEIFGPLLPVFTFTDISEVIRFISQRPKPLALYLFTTNHGIEHEVISNTSAGGVTINDTLMHFTNPNLPFGGVGNSGSGSYHGFASFEAFSHKKPVMKRSNLFDVPVRYAPFNNKLKLIKLLMK
jgi:aldehyde dehydrogenase (NAD+)